MRAPLPLLLVALAAPYTSAAQEPLVERWTIGYLAGGWSPRWDEPSLPLVGPSSAQPARVSVRVGVEAVGVRSSLEQSHSTARLTVRQPLGDRFAGRLAVGSDAWRTRTDDRRLVDTPRSQVVAAGLEVVDSLRALGTVRLAATVGWDGALGGEGRLSVEDDRYDWGVTVWRARGRGSRVFFPADSLREIGLRHVASGVRTEAGGAVRLGDVTLRPRGLWEYEALDGHATAPEAFLHAAPSGRAVVYQVTMDAAFGSWGLMAAYRSHEVDLDGTLYRLTASAGRVFFADMDYRSWSSGVQRRLGGGRWWVRVGGERAAGSLSTRVETWPFVDLWAQLSTLAYRLRGNLDARALSMSAGRASISPTGWSWSVDTGRYVVHADRDSWFVTSLGLGRSDREQTATGVDPAIVVGGDVARSFTVGGGTAGVRVEGGLPIHATRTGRGGTGASGPKSGDRGLAAYAGVSLSWWW